MVTMTRHCTEEVSDVSLPPVGIDVVLPPPPGLVVRHLAPPVLVLIFPLQIIQIILQFVTHSNKWVAFPPTVMPHLIRIRKLTLASYCHLQMR